MPRGSVSLLSGRQEKTTRTSPHHVAQRQHTALKSVNSFAKYHIKPTDLGYESACRLLSSTPTITIYSPKPDILTTLHYLKSVFKVGMLWITFVKFVVFITIIITRNNMPRWQARWHVESRAPTIRIRSRRQPRRVWPSDGHLIESTGRCNSIR